MNKWAGKCVRGFNWFARNNGNQIDSSRLRLTDGTPIHTTGLSRLNRSIEFTSILGVPLLIAIFSLATEPDKTWDNVLRPLPLMLAWAATRKIGVDYIFTFEMANVDDKNKSPSGRRYILNHEQIRRIDNLCFNTNPDPTTPRTSNKNMALATSALGWQTLPILANIIVPATTSSNFEELVSGLFMFAPGSIPSIGHIYRFRKVKNGDWVIEETPLPQPKAASTAEEPPRSGGLRTKAATVSVNINSELLPAVGA